MKICVATGTRAEYGLLRPLIFELQKEKSFTLQVLVTGAHLSPEFGLTIKEIEADSVPINKRVEMLLSSDTPTSIVKSMGIGMIGYSDALTELSPDALIILGDRYEMLALASTALILKIPIIHIHGGEVTEGAYDDAIRHAITKMSAIHFTSTEQYRKRVIQLGENPNTVFNVGAIGLDNVYNLKLLSRKELEKELGISFRKYNFQITYHPVTLGNKSSESQFQVLLNALALQEDSFFIFTKANADTDGRIINKMIDEFVHHYPEKATAYSSLGTLRFLSVVKCCDAMIGNSSSGIIEIPSLKVPTINIGDRQKGRLHSKSVIDIGMNENEIISAIEQVKSKEFKKIVDESINPYGDGSASTNIVNSLQKIDFKNLSVKKFYDVDFEI